MDNLDDISDLQIQHKVCFNYASSRAVAKQNLYQPLLTINFEFAGENHRSFLAQERSMSSTKQRDLSRYLRCNLSCYVAIDLRDVQFLCCRLAREPADGDLMPSLDVSEAAYAQSQTCHCVKVNRSVGAVRVAQTPAQPGMTEELVIVTQL